MLHEFFELFTTRYSFVFDVRDFYTLTCQDNEKDVSCAWLCFVTCFVTDYRQHDTEFFSFSRFPIIELALD
jgi:hypothetical protein